MPAFIILTVVIVVVVLIAKSVHDAQQGRESEQPSTPPPTRTPHRPARDQRRARPAPKPVDEAALAEHVRKLQQAIREELVTSDEAVGSICRFTDGALSEEAARELLHRQGAS